MEITINSKPFTLPEGTTLTEALKAAEIAPTGIATAVNGHVVKRDERDARTLAEGDSVVVIKAFYGG